MLLEVGRVVKPHGIKGEVIVDLSSNRPERVAPGSVLASGRGDLEVERSSPHQGRWIVAFAGVSSRDQAEAMRGTVLSAEPLDEEGTLWVHDLTGSWVYDTEGRFYGSVAAVEANPASDLLVLAGGLVPLTFVLDTADRRVVIDPPQGLIEPREPIEIVEYDPAWPARFEAEADRLRGALRDVAERIDHVGSTSVPGLAAKAIVDIQVSVRDVRDEARYRPALERLRYWHAPDPDMADYPFFGFPARPPRDVHVHVCTAGSEHERRHLAFRDLLREDEAVRAEYGALKRDLAARHGSDRAAYMHGKDELCARHSGPA